MACYVSPVAMFKRVVIDIPFLIELWGYYDWSKAGCLNSILVNAAQWSHCNPFSLAPSVASFWLDSACDISQVGIGR